MKRWLILNMNFDPLGNETQIPEWRRPTYLHHDREQAEKELLRLKEKWPRDDFVLFEAVAEARVIRMDAVRVEPIEDDGDLPF